MCPVLDTVVLKYMLCFPVICGRRLPSQWTVSGALDLYESFSVSIIVMRIIVLCRLVELLFILNSVTSRPNVVTAIASSKVAVRSLTFVGPMLRRDRDLIHSCALSYVGSREYHKRID